MFAARWPARSDPVKSQLLLLCMAAYNRRNWLFAGSDDGGERAAAIYTLLGTAKLNDLNPESYLRYVLERIADHPINQIEELLPWNLCGCNSSCKRPVYRLVFKYRLEAVTHED